MPAINETGHAKNVANFEDLIAFCNGYSTYNPTAASLSIASLGTKLTDARTAINGVIAAQTTFNNAVNVRKTAFEDLRPLATRVVNAFEACGADAEKVKDAKTINRKIQGKRATTKDTTPANGNPADTPPSGGTISASQQSYDQLMEHFARLINLLTTTAAYAPNETDINLTALATKLGVMQTTNTDVANTYTAWSNSRIARNAELYDDLTGLVATAGNVKKYVKSLFGSGSPQYKQVSALMFRVPKD
ncbi:MAG: hypothetical protein IPH18_12895 [Chitinophagaceae bacterium]|nr:hypothetical protein [Chitinophagaceae bacterium]